MCRRKMGIVYDYYKYLFFLKKKEGIRLIINLLIFITTLIPLIKEIKKLKALEKISWFMPIFFAFSLFNILWEIICKNQEIKSFSGDDREIEIEKKKKIMKEDHCFNLCEVKFFDNNDWNYNNINISSIDNNVISSVELNMYLWDKDLDLEIDIVKIKKIQEFIKNNKDVVTPFFQYQYYNSKKEDRYFFNENKLCMASDIFGSEHVIKCYKSNYFNSFLTNEICMFALKRKKDMIVLYDATNIYPCKYNKSNGTYYLQSIEDSRMNNHIGVSTLAFTKNNRLVIRKQGGKTQQNIGKYVPTGSGSCDWLDIRKNSFTETIVYAMKRELWEENGRAAISPTIEGVGETKILGFFRWLERGGKPEFVGITKLNCSYNDMELNFEELVETSTSVDMDVFSVRNIDDIIDTIKIIRKERHLSVPLSLCLDALELYSNRRAEELSTFLGFF